MNGIITIPHFRQSKEGHCLPACGRMALAHLGFDRTEAEISQILGTEDWGTPSFAIKRLASPDIEVSYQEWSISELLAILTAGQPVIAFVRTGFLEYYQEDFAQAVVIVGANPNKTFWLQDPAQTNGPIEVSWDGLLAAWAEFGYRGAVLTRK